jgi:signal peptidase I
VKAMLKIISKYWRKATEGWIGWITYALLGIILAYATNFVLGILLKTDLPLVVVVSNSMAHKPVNGILCGELVTDFKNTFEDYWRYCEKSFKNLGITKEEFMKFPFKNGLNVGDVALIKGSEKYEIGDIIVYSTKESSYPIIHRVVALNDDGTYQTKGDHNFAQLPYEYSIKKDEIHGKVIFIFPYIGLIKVLFVRLIGI